MSQARRFVGGGATRAAAADGGNAAPTPTTSAGDADTDAKAAADKRDGTALFEEYEKKHTLSALYLPRQPEQSFVAVDHHARRRERDIKEIAEAARKLGKSEEDVRAALAQLVTLLPGLEPNLFKLRARDWARITSDVARTASTLITFKSLYPGVDAARVVAVRPQLLLQEPGKLTGDAEEVRSLLAQLGPEDFDNVIQTVPALVDPATLRASLAQLQASFPGKDAIDLLARDPARLLQVSEADLEADPLYGWTST